MCDKDVYLTMPIETGYVEVSGNINNVVYELWHSTYFQRCEIKDGLHRK